MRRGSAGAARPPYQFPDETTPPAKKSELNVKLRFVNDPPAEIPPT